jgi:hypothetical protein
MTPIIQKPKSSAESLQPRPRNQTLVALRGVIVLMIATSHYLFMYDLPNSDLSLSVKGFISNFSWLRVPILDRKSVV